MTVSAGHSPQAVTGTGASRAGTGDDDRDLFCVFSPSKTKRLGFLDFYKHVCVCFVLSQEEQRRTFPLVTSPTSRGPEKPAVTPWSASPQHPPKSQPVSPKAQPHLSSTSLSQGDSSS